MIAQLRSPDRFDVRRPSSGLLADTLAGSWRRDAPELRLSTEELDRVTPLLLGSGAAPLAWWRIKSLESLTKSPAAAQLQQAYRLRSVHEVTQQRAICMVLGLLRTAQIEPILAKGWAIARGYPETLLRPYGDLDILVRPEQYRSAKAIVDTPEAADCQVDLHERFSELEDRSLDELFARSQLVDLEGTAVRVLSAEDHLALLCIHFLKHGAWRPLWLCDIGVMLESLPANFDWDICLGADPRRARWIACTLELAHQLLQARIDRMPVNRRAGPLPGWLVPAVLKAWENPVPDWMRTFVALRRLQPGSLLKQIRGCWTDPISATYELKAPFNELPRFPLQLSHFLWRALKFMVKLIRPNDAAGPELSSP